MRLHMIAFLATVSMFLALGANAENQQGTGGDIRVLINGSNRIVIESDLTQGKIIGSSLAESGYAELILDQIQNDGQIKLSWGKAEVLLGCYQADVQLYQQVDGFWQEYTASQVETSFCLPE